MPYFTKRTRTRPLKKAEPGCLEKADPILKFTVGVKNRFFDNFEGADLKHDNSFLRIFISAPNFEL